MNTSRLGLMTPGPGKRSQKLAVNSLMPRLDQGAAVAQSSPVVRVMGIGRGWPRGKPVHQQKQGHFTPGGPAVAPPS